MTGRPLQRSVRNLSGIASVAALAAVTLCLTGCSGSSDRTAAASSQPVPTTAVSSSSAVSPVAGTLHTSTDPHSSASTQPSASTPPSASSRPTPAATTHTSSSTPSPATASSGAATDDCTNAQLSVGHKTANGGGSHGGIIVIFINKSSSTCSLAGYPGAAVLNSSDSQIVQATRTLYGYLGNCRCSSPPRLRLQSGDAASTVVEGDNGGGDECLRGRAFLVTPPNTRQSTRIAFTGYSCHVQVHPVIAGTSGTR